MPGASQGSIRLFRFSGIDVFLHWSWFLVAAYEIQTRKGSYSSVTWNVLEYLALFLIVMIHEFGHALACRQVGGRADRIVLWPLGGVAYVDPPPRPGATLWSIAAGPLVNVALLPVLFVAVALGRSAGWAETMPDLYQLVRAISFINLGLLIFNILPIYPLDGGQILRSLLWFVLGRARSLMVAAIVGLLGVVGLHRAGSVEARRLVGRDRAIHADELLAWTETSAGVVAIRKSSAPRWPRLPELQDITTSRRILAMRKMRPAIRHVSNRSCLSTLRRTILSDQVPRLRCT